jgi:hypothetical protein
MSYATLKTDAADYLHRTDLTAKMAAFITLAEANLFRELFVKDTELIVSGVTVGEYGTLPADFGKVSRVTASVGDSEYNLNYKSPDYTTTLSYPESYALENNKIRIFGTSTGQAYTLYYIPKLVALSDSNTNWLHDNAYDLYLYATALEAAKYIRDGQEIANLMPMVANLIDSVRRTSERKGQPATGSMQIIPRR